MLMTSVKSFKLIAWKLWAGLITQTFYPTLKPNLKIVPYWSLTWKLSKSVILSKIIFLLAKSHMYIFNMFIISVRSFKLIAWNPWKVLITQTCYCMLKANLKIVLSQKCHNFVKNYFFVCKNWHAHLQYIHNKYARFQFDPLKTVRRVDYTNSIPYNAKSRLKWLSSKGCNSVKINFSSIKNPHAYFQYVYNKYARFQKDPLKTVWGVDYTNFIPYIAKSCLKWLSSKGCNSVKINFSSIKNPHAHLQYVHNKYARFQKGPLKTVRGIDYTNSIP